MCEEDQALVWALRSLYICLLNADQPELWSEMLMVPGTYQKERILLKIISSFPWVVLHQKGALVEINCKKTGVYNIVRSVITQKTADIILLWNFIEHISYPYKPRSHDPSLVFGPLDICTVNHHPPVDLCLDSNEDRATGFYSINRSQRNRLIRSRWFSTLHITNLLTVMHVHSAVKNICVQFC